MVKRGKLFVFEGLDKAGKSTAAHQAVAWLQEQGQPAMYVKAPGQTALGKVLREIVLNQRVTGHMPLDEGTAVAGGEPGPKRWYYELPAPFADSLTKDLLHLADLRETLTQVVEPALAQGTWVIQDRSHISTLAYSMARGTEAKAVRQLVDAVVPTRPRNEAHYLLFEIPVETFLARRAAHGSDDAADDLDEPFYRRVQANYIRLAYLYAMAECWYSVNASRPQYKVQERVCDIIRPHLEKAA